MMYKKRNIVFSILFVFFSFSAFSKDSALLSPLEWVESFESYLHNLGPITGKFTQIDQSGIISKGTFWSSGKGAVKFSFAPKSGLLIAIVDGLITVKEGENSPINLYSIKGSPLGNLFSSNFSLNSFIISNIDITGSVGTIEIRTKEGSTRDSLYLVGDYPNPKLRQWKLIDHQNNETLVFFSKIEESSFLDENFFKIK